MKIDSLAPIHKTSPRRGARDHRAGSGNFSQELSNEARGPSSVGGGAALGPVDALLALQEVMEPGGGRGQAGQRGQDLLDHLDDLQLALLTGRLPLDRLERLHDLLAEKADISADPRLAGVIEEIELRAAVELAKLGR